MCFIDCFDYTQKKTWTINLTYKNPKVDVHPICPLQSIFPIP